MLILEGKGLGSGSTPVLVLCRKLPEPAFWELRLSCWASGTDATHFTREATRDISRPQVASLNGTLERKT